LTGWMFSSRDKNWSSSLSSFSQGMN
jgi:hypothetical protein